MEIKVWVDGIQRVVCGVSEHTTCRDVILALAHATGRTGRYAMIERWRGRDDRRLAPTDRPVRVLQNWGDCANDIQFVLRHTTLTGGGGGADRGGYRGVSLSRLTGLPSSVLQTPRDSFSSGERRSANHRLSKARTFSGPHTSTARGNTAPNDDVMRQPVTAMIVNNHSLESSEQSSVTSQSSVASPSSTSASPYTSLERRRPRTGQENITSKLSSGSSIQNGGFTVTSQRPPLYINNNYKSRAPDDVSSLVSLNTSAKQLNGRTYGQLPNSNDGIVSVKSSAFRSASENNRLIQQSIDAKVTMNMVNSESPLSVTSTNLRERTENSLLRYSASDANQNADARLLSNSNPGALHSVAVSNRDTSSLPPPVSVGKFSVRPSTSTDSSAPSTKDNIVRSSEQSSSDVGTSSGISRFADTRSMFAKLEVEKGSQELLSASTLDKARLRRVVKEQAEELQRTELQLASLKAGEQLATSITSLTRVIHDSFPTLKSRGRQSANRPPLVFRV